MMRTKYEITFTKDNEVVFESDLIADDETFKDVPPTVQLFTTDEVNVLWSVVKTAYMKNVQSENIHNRLVYGPALKRVYEKVLKMRLGEVEEL